MNKVIVTGGTGLLGKKVVAELLDEYNYEDIVVLDSKFDLLNKDNFITRHFDAECNNTVIHLAAKVGGIGANSYSPADFFYNNMQMGLNVINSCLNTFNVYKNKYGFKPDVKIIMVSTVCSYPKNCPIPFKEEDIWNGFPEETNAPYGIAKKSLMEYLYACNKQYGLKSTTLNLSNLYGGQEKGLTENNHVIPSIISKIVHAISKGIETVKLWGDGSPTRDFLHISDASKAVVQAIKLGTCERFGINVGSGVEISILDLANTINQILGNKVTIVWDLDKPNGQPRRCLDITKANSILQWKPTVDFYSSLKKQCEQYAKKYEIW